MEVLPALRSRVLSPLPLAGFAFFVGGLGNVAFSLHAGSQSALALLRFGFGLLLAGGFLAGRRSLRARPPLPSPAPRPWRWLVLAGGFEAAGISLLMASADHVSTAVFTVIGMSAPAVTALLARPLGLPRAAPAAAGLAAAALLAAGLAVLSTNGSQVQVTALGVVLAVASVLCASVSAVAASVAVRVYHPASLLAVACALGMVVAAAWAFAGAPLTVTPSTVVAAAFIAVVPGGVAKVVWLWANARSSPQLVQSLVAVSVVSAMLGGWWLLGETPTWSQAVFSVVAAALVGALAFLRAPTRPALPRPGVAHD